MITTHETDMKTVTRMVTGTGKEKDGFAKTETKRKMATK